ncbi:hypothetical protein C8R44DRAFT_903596 [Mycena epipterygia]|nr:hypothetical protein C8R44DRAFT_903596 [Mycena epipterygia]
MSGLQQKTNYQCSPTVSLEPASHHFSCCQFQLTRFDGGETVLAEQTAALCLDRQLAATPKLAPVWTHWEIGWRPAFRHIVPAITDMYSTHHVQLENTCLTVGGVVLARYIFRRSHYGACTTTTAATAQKSLVDAAKLVAVKLFVSSEYGMPTKGQTEGVLAEKNQINGIFTEFVRGSSGISTRRKFNSLEKAYKYVPTINFYHCTTILTASAGQAPRGSIDAPHPFPLGMPTYTRDFPPFYNVLTTLPPTELENRIFRLEGERRSLNSLGELFKASVKHVDHVTGEAGELKTHLLAAVDSGAGSSGWDAGNKVEGSGSKAAGIGNAV